METRPKYINQSSFYGSDYFLTRIGYEEKWNRVKRLGDTYYENELLERSVTEKYGSNLKIGKVDNTAAAIGATGSGKLSIDEYVGDNLENVDKLKTVGGSVGISTSGINSIGINYNDRKQEGITKNTVIGNVEIGKSSGAEINKDLASMTEITKDRKFETNINIESQTIKYALNPEAFKQDLKKAKNEIEDIGNVIENTVNPPGEDKRNFFKNLRAQRWNTSFYNVTGSRMEELSRQFKAGEINENQLKEAARDLIKGYGKDIGIDFEVVYLDEETMPKDSKGSTGSSYILDKKNKKVLIPIDVSKIGDINELLGTLTEEVSHGKDALEGRQDKKVAEDKSNDEEGLESLGRPANDYVKNKLGEDNNSKIKLSTDGIDLTNANVGEKVGDVITPEDRKFRTEYQAKYIQIDFDRTLNGMIGLTGSAFRGVGSYGLIKSGVSLLLIPEPTPATKIAGIIVTGYGIGEAVFSFLDGAESGQDVYYGVTNQKNKKSVNFGKDFLGEEGYMILNATSGKGVPFIYQFADYTRVIAEGEAAQKALVTNPTNQNADNSPKNNQPLYREKTKTDNSNSNQGQKNENKKPTENKSGAYKKDEELKSPKQDLKKVDYLYKEFQRNLEAESKMQGVPDEANYQHIIYGEINGRGRAVGGHSLLGGDIRKASNSSITNYSNGVYEMMIEVKDANGNWIPKSAPTTMYPVTWSEGRIKYEVSEAFNNWRKETQNLNTNVTGKWSGVSPSGVTIEGFVQNDYITTAYPQRPVSTP